MKKLTILLLPFLMLSCSKLEELTPPDQLPSHWQVHVFINKSTCSVNINGKTEYMGDGISQSVVVFKVQHLEYLYFYSYEKGCALTIFKGRNRTELGYVPYFQYTNRD